MRDLEHARAWHGAVNDSGDVNVKRSEPFGTRIKQTICCQNVNELERVMRADEAVFPLKSDCDGGHSSVGVGALLILLMCDALHGCRRLMTGLCVRKKGVVKVWVVKQRGGRRERYKIGRAHV